MDNWFTIVLALIFFGLPFLEGVLKKSKRRQQGGGSPPVTHDSNLPPRERVGSALPDGASDSYDDSSWSDGWGSWPGEELEEEQESEGVTPWSTLEAPDRFGAEARRPEVLPPPETDARSADPLPLPKAKEPPTPQRLQDLAARLNEVAQANTSPRPALRPTVAPAPLRVTPVARKHRVGIAADLLDDRASVRRAIIVSEVLGAPLALRDRPRD